MKTAQDFNSNFEQYNAQIEKEIANLNRMRDELQANGAVAQQIINDLEPVLANYGDSIETFQEDKLLKEYMNYKINDWMGATIPPNIVHRDIWDLVGGYSIEYSPGMYSDPDFTAKLYMCGVRFMKGLQASRIYHFETKSTTRIRKNCGQMQFLLKWGMTSSTFRKVFTYKGKDFKSQKIGTFKTGNRFKISLIRGRLKAIFYLLTKDFGPLWKFWKKTFV